MKSLLGWLVVLAIIVGAAGFGLWQFSETTTQQAYQLQLAAIKADFARDAIGLHELESNDYEKEVGIALTSYFQRLGKLAKEYPKQFDIEREKKTGHAEFERGRMTETQKLARDERIDITVDLFERMRGGEYRPLFSDADNGFRFDIYDISPAKVSGEQTIKLSYVHWGAYGPVTYNSIVGSFETEQRQGRAAIQQIVGEGQPPTLQIEPSQWVTEFPPSMEIGYYTLPQFPRQATGLELAFGFGIRTVGGTLIESKIEFEKIPVPEAWKVPEGQAWEAQERLASDDELRAAGANIPEVR
jgi:hypothetical protein